MYKHYFFDFDGTLFNGYPHIIKCFNKMMMEKRGITIDDDSLYSMFMKSSKVVFEYYGITKEEAELYKKYQEDNSILPLIEPFDGVKEMLDNLKSSGVSIYMYTNRGNSMYPLLDRYGLTSYFIDYIAHAGKPDPKPLIDLLNKYGLNSSECLVIGDRKLDIDGAHNANIDAFYIGNKNDLQAEHYGNSVLDILKLEK